MKASELTKGNKYLYTAPCDPIEVTYMYETINGYMFESGGVTNELNAIDVKFYIEPVKP